MPPHRKPSVLLPYLLSAGPLAALPACQSDSASQERLYVSPYLQNPTANSMTVVWWTDSSTSDNELSYESEGSNQVVEATNEFVDSVDKWRHVATATGLVPGQRYSYHVQSGNLTSESYEFDGPKTRDDDIVLHFLGDGRTDDDAIIALHRQVMSEGANADLLVELGDTVYASSDDHWFRYLRRVLTASDAKDPGSTTGSTIPTLHINGNHETATLTDNPDAEASEYYQKPEEAHQRFSDLFVHPPNQDPNEAWRELYYVVDFGPATLIVLDANNTSRDDLDNHDYLADGTTPDWEPGSTQYNWLIEQLERAQSQSVMTIVMTHPSPYSSGEHGTDIRSGEGSDDQRGHELRILDPIFRQYGVDAVITSHDHLAERSLVGPNGDATDVGAPENINYFVLGNSGSHSRDSANGWESWMSVNEDGAAPYYRKWYYDWATDDSKACYIRLSLENGGTGEWTANFSVVRSDGQVFDDFSLTRSDPLFAAKLPPQGSRER